MNQEPNFFIEKPESKSKKFWRVVLGSMVGFIFSSIIISFLSFFFTIAILASLKPSTPVIAENSVLKINLPYEIVERAIDNPFEGLEMFGINHNQIGLDEILKSIRHAASDQNIKGIYLNTSSIMAPPATIKEIRDELLKFKESGKFIYAYSDSYTQNGYFLSSVADRVALNSKGSLDFKGIASQILFYKGLIEKLSLDIQIVRHGEFKSAVEPYMLDKMSEANREQMTLLTNSIWNTILTEISKSRKMDMDSLNHIADGLLCENAEKALALGLVDEICYSKDVEKTLKSLSGVDASSKLNLITLSDYKKTTPNLDGKGKDKIAVIYATGNIIDGKSNNSSIGSESFIKNLRKAYSDDNVKSIVLRVNSPGGSALASEAMWHEIEMAKKAGKKVVTSMGDYAASGGYYIACNSDVIIAQPNTLTGSIGVFGMIPSMQNFLKEKLGITIDVVKTNPHADYSSGLRKMDDFELKKMQIMVDEVYDTFVQRVANGRVMDPDKVDKIGQGRVWSGKDALKIGLVDELGTIEDAVKKAAELSKITDYKIEYYPKKQDWITLLLGGDKEQIALQQLKEEMGELYYTYVVLKEIMDATGVQARMSMEMIIE